MALGRMAPPSAPTSPIIEPATAVLVGQRKGTSWNRAPLPAPSAAKQNMNSSVVTNKVGAAVSIRNEPTAASRTTVSTRMPPIRSAK